MQNPSLHNLKLLLDSHLEIQQNMFKSNPTLSDLNGFTFGIHPDFPEEYQYFAQNFRIDLLNKAIVDVLDIEFLKDEGLITDYSGIHNCQDLDIIKTYIANLSMCYK